MGLQAGGLITGIIGRIVSSEIWGAYFWEGLLSEGYLHMIFEGSLFSGEGELGLIGNSTVYYKFCLSFADHIQPEVDFPDQVFHQVFCVSVLGHIEIEQGAWSSCKFNQVRAQIKK